MVPKKLFPCAMGACLALSMLSIAVSAQTVETRHRQVAQNVELNDLPVVSDDPVIISLATDEEIKAAEALTSPTAVGFKFQQMMSAAIDQRLGARYVWGATGPSRFDCSGFVWSTFQSAGINFDRSSARTLWARFAPATEEEKFKFGTLVFFRGRRHIGIVADENGFYHASRHHGVVYSPFNKYWLSRIDGFRRVPLPVGVEPILD
jgi:peptidoglycan endopeptidase LytE